MHLFLDRIRRLKSEEVLRSQISPRLIDSSRVQIMFGNSKVEPGGATIPDKAVTLMSQ